MIKSYGGVNVDPPCKIETEYVRVSVASASVAVGKVTELLPSLSTVTSAMLPASTGAELGYSVTVTDTVASKWSYPAESPTEFESSTLIPTECGPTSPLLGATCTVC